MLKPTRWATCVATHLERYPTGEFSAIARTLADHYDRKLKAEQAAQEEERKRLENERKAAEVKRLEEERRVREAVIAEEHKRAQQAKGAEEQRLLEEQHGAELLKRTEELRKALEEARLAREAAKLAEAQRVAAVKAAEAATKAANDAIASKRDSEHHSDPSKVAALPKLEQPKGRDPKARVFAVEPPVGIHALGWGEKAYVDDGSCPAGKIKQVIGGGPGGNPKRQRSCVNR